MVREFKRQIKKSTKRAKLRKEASAWREEQPRVCPICCDREAVHEHHIFRKGMGGSLKAECNANRILICEKCHAMIHAYQMPIAVVLRAKKDVGGYDHEALEDIAGHRLPALIFADSTEPG